MATILIIEDQPLTIMLIEKILREISPIVLKASDGKEAMETYLSHPEIDLILMDLHLPSISGLSLTDTIRATSVYAARPIPIIAVTANSLMTDEKEFLINTGLADYITKPIHPERMLSSVMHHLRLAATTSDTAAQ